MRKNPKILGLIVMAILIVSSSVFADAADQWGYSKEVVYDNQEEVKAIYLDEEVYPYAKKDLSDIRLINEKNEYIPYYIYNGYRSGHTEQYMTYPGVEILSFMKDNDYYVDYEISPKEKNEDIIANKLDIEVDKDSFYKEIKILASYDNKTWDTIKTDIIYKINGQSKTIISLEGDYKYPYYRIISVSDMAELPISHLTLIYDQIESTYDKHKKSKAIDYELEIKKETKETIVKIHNKQRLKISNIKIQSNNDFNRKYDVYMTNKEGEEIQKITEGSIYKFKLETFDVEDMTISLEDTIEDFIAPEYLEVIIKDRDDQPIAIEAIEIDYYIDKLVFKSNDAKGIQLLFGNELATKPDYDISNYIGEMEKSKQEKAELLDLVQRDIKQSQEEAGLDFKLILNIAVVIISALLVIIILKKK